MQWLSALPPYWHWELVYPHSSPLWADSNPGHQSGTVWGAPVRLSSPTLDKIWKPIFCVSSCFFLVAELVGWWLEQEFTTAQSHHCRRWGSADFLPLLMVRISWLFTTAEGEHQAIFTTTYVGWGLASFQPLLKVRISWLFTTVKVKIGWFWTTAQKVRISWLFTTVKVRCAPKWTHDKRFGSNWIKWLAF